MSLRVIEQASHRLNRCELTVPGSRTEMFAKAAKTDADIIVLDLEDSVSPDDKDQARRDVIAALNDADWRGKTLSVRVNGLDTPYTYRDVVDLFEQAGGRFDLLMIPKVGNAGDVYAIDMLATQIEMAKGIDRRAGFELIIESAAGLMNLEEIADASRRSESVHFGAGDFAASVKARIGTIGGVDPYYSVLTNADQAGNRETHWGDLWHFALSRMVMVARAKGLRPIDGAFGNFSDAEGYRASARRGAALGCEGKWAIHPSQIPIANEIFSPTADEVASARNVLAAMADAAAEGKGAVTLDGQMIDVASIRQAEVVVNKAEAIAQAKSA